MLLKKYQNGGTPVVTPVVTPKATQVYENGPKWDEYQKNQAANKNYNTYSALGKTWESEGATNPTNITNKQFAAQFPDFKSDTTKDIVGYTQYDTNGLDVSKSSNGNSFYTTPKGKAYLPVYAQTPGNYEVVENPEIAKQKKATANWAAANNNAGIKGYTVTKFVNPQTNKWEEEYRPTKQVQGNRNNAEYIPFANLAEAQRSKIVGGAPAVSASFSNGGAFYTQIKRLVSFGNFLLSKERNKSVTGPSKDNVGDWDLANHFGDKYKTKK